MAVLDKWDLLLTSDLVLQAQGAEIEIINSRKPFLVASAEQALVRGLPLLHPMVLYEKYPVKQIIHNQIELASPNSNHGKYILSGPLIAQHLARAEYIIVLLCSVGSELEDTVSSLFNVDPVAALALDGVGSAAVEMLAVQACNHFEIQANKEGLKTSIPLNPGMIGWPVEIGQQQIFSLLDCEAIDVSLTDSWMMVPNKSLSMVLGIGKNISPTGSTCEYCSLQHDCRYQNHYVK